MNKSLLTLTACNVLCACVTGLSVLSGAARSESSDGMAHRQSVLAADLQKLQNAITVVEGDDDQPAIVQIQVGQHYFYFHNNGLFGRFDQVDSDAFNHGEFKTYPPMYQRGVPVKLVELNK